MDGLYEQQADILASYLYGNSGNSIGVIASVSAGTGPVESGDEITLTEPTQAINFEVGMLIDTWDNDGSDTVGVQDDAGVMVVGVNRAEGVIEVAVADSPITATGGEYLFRTGDYGAAAGTFVFHGLGSFLWPDDTPPPIYSMTRTDDPQRLAGSRVPAADLVGLNIEERIQILGAYMTGRFKGPGPTHGFMNPEDWQNLAISLQSRGVRPLKDDTTRFNFMAIEVVMGGKLVRIYPDRFCPRGTFFALRLKDFTLHSMLKLIHPISQDGLVILRKSDANDYEYRIVSYPAVCTVAPGWSGRVALA